MSTIVVTANVVPNAANVVDLWWSPSSLHTHLHQSVDVLHLLETDVPPSSFLDSKESNYVKERNGLELGAAPSFQH